MASDTYDARLASKRWRGFDPIRSHRPPENHMGWTATPTPSKRAASRRALLLVATLALTIGATWWAPPGAALAQPGVQPDFAVDAVAFRSVRGDFPRVDIHTRVAFRGLQFVRRGEGFAGNYRISATVHRTGRNDRPDGLVLTRSWTRDVRADSYATAQADSLADYSSLSLDLPPGRYVLRVRLDDGASNRSATREQVITVPSFSGAVSMSDLLLVDRFDASSQRRSPLVLNMVSTDDATVGVFYEVYARHSERVRVRYTLNQVGVERRSWIRGLFGSRERETSTALRETVDLLALRTGSNAAGRSFAVRDLDVGEYRIEVQVERMDGSIIASRTAPLTVRWSGPFDEIQDLDTAIAALRYIAKDREIQAMRNAPSLTDRLRLFQEFWDKRDPSPGSPRNESMEEYYMRVAHANRNYGQRGWESDRGEVIIRFGEPDMVENHAAGAGSRPYQVWYYNRMGRRFIFVEDGSSGDYRLMVPIWDERTRM